MKRVHFETDRGEIVAELFDEEVPGTVANFAGLAAGTQEWTDPKTGQKVKRPFYDGLNFHRYEPGFVIQGGCPMGNGRGGPGYTIKCETQKNTHKHGPGALSMAHAGKDTGGSQFFICLGTPRHLDGRHTVFGQVTSGMEVVQAIRAGDRMKKVWVEG
jgi:peptidyl-prolyl cis-trans isomerase B (cyclophilin B)